MLLKVIDIHHDHEQESDYETAVDMSHCTIDEVAVLFETPSGVRFSISSRSTSTSYSYMEPDWDHLEKTGAVSYETHSDGNRRESSEWVGWSDLLIANAHASITLDEFREAFQRKHQKAFEVFHDESLPESLRTRVAQHMSGGDGRPNKASMHADYEGGLMEPGYVASGIGQEEAAALSELTLHVGQIVEFQISPAFEQSIERAEKLHAQVSASNASITSENRARAACARVQELIDEMATKANADMRRSFSSLMLANR